MPAIPRTGAALLLIDFQARLMPAIEAGAARLAEAMRLARAAKLLGVPVLATEQNPGGLGGSAPDLAALADRVLSKMHFDATRAEGFEALVGEARTLVVGGCETHVCVLQTVLGLRARGLRVCVAADAVGSRRAESRMTGLARMAADGAEIVTAEMAIFEWLESCEHPRFREVLALVK